MPRVKRGMHHAKRRKGILKHTKGFEAGRKKLIGIAKVAETKAGAHAYRNRRVKKRINKGLWHVKINAGVRPLGMTYSTFVGSLNKKKILIDRKVLAQIAEQYPKAFEQIVAAAK